MPGFSTSFANIIILSARGKCHSVDLTVDIAAVRIFSEVSDSEACFSFKKKKGKISYFHFFSSALIINIIY